MSRYDSVRERYLHDNAFHHVVDALQGIVLQLELTPSELREAAMLACILLEERHTKPFRVTFEDYERWRKGDKP